MKIKLLILLFAICKLTTGQNITANFGSSIVCFGDTTCFYDNSMTSSGASIIDWHWTFGDGTQSALQNPCHIYGTYGNYIAQLVVTNSNGDKDSVMQPVILHPSPIANFSYTTACAGMLTGFTDMSTVNTGSINYWFWDFGNSDFSIEQFTFKTFTAAGNYNVTLIIRTEHNCIDSITLPVTVNNCTGLDLISKNEPTKNFPNPFSSQTTIQTDKVLKNAIMTVYNSYGQQIKQIENVSGQTITFHRDNLSSGIYFLRLTQDNETIQTEVIVITDK